jgi:hypothetical protein
MGKIVIETDEKQTVFRIGPAELQFQFRGPQARMVRPVAFPFYSLSPRVSHFQKFDQLAWNLYLKDRY